MGRLIQADAPRWANKPNPFRDFRIMYPGTPTVTQTFRKFDAPLLIKIVIDTFGTRCAFSASECMQLDQIREVMGDISVRSFGGCLGQMGHDFSGYRIEKIGEDRNGAVWWVCEFS